MKLKLHNFLVLGTSLGLIATATFAFSSCGDKTDPYTSLSTGATYVITNQSDANFLLRHAIDQIESYGYSVIAAADVPAAGLEYGNNVGVLASRIYWEMAYNFSINYHKKQTIKFTYPSTQPWYTEFVGTITNNIVKINANINDTITTYNCRYVAVDGSVKFYLNDVSSISQYFLNVAIK